MLLNGAVTLITGQFIYKLWPLSGLRVIGIFVDIDLILNCWGWVMLAIAVRKAPPAEPVAS